MCVYMSACLFVSTYIVLWSVYFFSFLLKLAVITVALSCFARVEGSVLLFTQRTDKSHTLQNGTQKLEGCQILACDTSRAYSSYLYEKAD